MGRGRAPGGVWGLDGEGAGGSITPVWEGATPLLRQRNANYSGLSPASVSDLSREGLGDPGEGVAGLRHGMEERGWDVGCGRRDPQVWSAQVGLQRGWGVPGALGQGDWGNESFGEKELEQH